MKRRQEMLAGWVKRRQSLPAGWRQPPETTAEPVPLRRPYLGTPLPHPAQPPQPRFVAQARPAAQGQAPTRAPGGTAVPHPAPAQAPWGAAPHPAPTRAPGGPAGPRPVTNPAPGARPAPPNARRPQGMRRWRPMRAIIGDELRVPMLWCESGTCIERYVDDGALGEGDLRAGALAAGWRYDTSGRLTCPACAHDPAFRGRRRG